MSQIRSKDTKPEMVIRKALFSAGYRYKLHVRALPGKPDIVLPKYKVIIFVNGCFWHGHQDCKYFVVPKTRTEWWLKKISRCQQLDRENIGELSRRGWEILSIYECELKSSKKENTIKKLFEHLEKLKLCNKAD